MAQSPVDYGAMPEDIESRSALVTSEPELDVKCNRCGELVCSQRRAVALGWWFGAFVIAGVVGAATRATVFGGAEHAAAPQLAIDAQDLPTQPSTAALALLKAFDRDGAGALDVSELTTMLGAQTAAKSGGAKQLAQSAGEAQATKLVSMFDADASGALDAVELTRALEIQETARAAKQTPGAQLNAANNNPYTADDTWNCMGAGGRCSESSSTDSSSTASTTKKSKGAEGTKSTDSEDSGADDAVNCSTHDDCNDLYPDQLDDNWLAVTDDKKKKSGSGSGAKVEAKAVDDDTTKTNEWHHHAHSTTCISDSDCSSKYTCESGQCMPYQPDTSS